MAIWVRVRAKRFWAQAVCVPDRLDGDATLPTGQRCFHLHRLGLSYHNFHLYISLSAVAEQETVSECLRTCITPLAKLERSFHYIFNNFEKVWSFITSLIASSQSNKDSKSVGVSGFRTRKDNIQN